MRHGKRGDNSLDRSNVEQIVQNRWVICQIDNIDRGRGKAFNPATKRLFEYGLIGLAIGAAMVAGLQFKPQNVFPTNGILQVSIQSDPVTVACHGKQSGSVMLTSLVVNISSVKVHRSGALNLTGEWISLNDTPQTVDLFQLKTAGQLGSTSVEEGTINVVRIDVSGARASSDKGPIDLVISSNHLQAEPAASVNEGMTTNITVTPHVVCEGNGTLRLTPELTATSSESRD